MEWPQLLLSVGGEEAAEGTVSRGQLDRRAIADDRRDLAHQLPRVEAVDPLRLHQRHEQALLRDQRPHQAEGAHRDGAALQPAREEEALDQRAAPQPEARRPRLAGGGREEHAIGRQQGQARLHEVWHGGGDHPGITRGQARAPGRGGRCRLAHEGLDGRRRARFHRAHQARSHVLPLLGVTLHQLLERGPLERGQILAVRWWHGSRR